MTTSSSKLACAGGKLEEHCNVVHATAVFVCYSDDERISEWLTSLTLLIVARRNRNRGRGSRWRRRRRRRGWCWRNWCSDIPAAAADSQDRGPDYYCQGRSAHKSPLRNAATRPRIWAALIAERGRHSGGIGQVQPRRP